MYSRIDINVITNNRLKEIKTVTLSKQFINHKHFIPMLKFLFQHISIHPYTFDLKIYEVKDNKEMLMSELFNQLQSLLNQSSSIESLEFHGQKENSSYNTLKCLANCIENGGKVLELSIYNININALNESGLLKTIKNHKFIQRIGFYNMQVDASQRDLTIFYSDLKEIITSNPSIISLRMNDYLLPLQQMQLFANTHSLIHLQELWLMNDGQQPLLNDEGFNSIVNSLMSSQIKWLCLSANINIKNLKNLESLLIHNSTIKSVMLTLIFKNFDDTGLIILNHFFAALKNKTTLESVYFYFSHIDITAISTIGNLVETNTMLSMAQISGTNINYCSLRAENESQEVALRINILGKQLQSSRLMTLNFPLRIITSEIILAIKELILNAKILNTLVIDCPKIFNESFFLSSENILATQELLLAIESKKFLNVFMKSKDFINKLRESIEICNEEYLIHNNCSRIIQTKINKGLLDIESTSAQRPLLYLACLYDRFDIAKSLLENGADPNRQVAFNGKTALHIAAEKGNLRIVELLLHHKATINTKSYNFVTPLYYAQKNNHPEVVKYLVEKGAKNFNIFSPALLRPKHKGASIGDRFLKNCRTEAETMVPSVKKP